jgi:putative ABC transport system substrate-binding protein
MIDRRVFVAGMVAMMATPRSAGAQQAGKVPRIGVVSGASPDPLHPVRGLRQGLRDIGYADGHNIIVEYRWAQGRLERILDLVAELLAPPAGSPGRG